MKSPPALVTDDKEQSAFVCAWARSLALDSLILATESLHASKEWVGTDPLSAEKYLHNVRVLSEVASTVYLLSETIRKERILENE